MVGAFELEDIDTFRVLEEGGRAGGGHPLVIGLPRRVGCFRNAGWVGELRFSLFLLCLWGVEVAWWLGGPVLRSSHRFLIRGGRFR